MSAAMLRRAPVFRTPLATGRPLTSKRLSVRPLNRKVAVAPQAFFGGGNKAAATSAQFHICIDCGYIYDNSGGPWAEVPSFFRCPACNSPKSRFKVYKGDDVKGKPNNAKATMQKRKAEKKW